MYERNVQPAPKLSEFKAKLSEWLELDAKLPKNQRRTAQRLFEGQVEAGYLDAYDSIQRFVKQWKLDHRHSPSTQQAFVPLVFQPGEVCQFEYGIPPCVTWWAIPGTVILGSLAMGG